MILVVLVTRSWVDVPYWDEWDLGAAIIQYHNGTLGFERLIAQHNEHRPLVLRLIVIGLSLVSTWDIRWEMGLSLLLAGATFAGIARLPFPHPPSSLRRRVVLLLISLVLFSPVQWENWLMGMQFGVFIPPLFLVMGLHVCLSHRPLWIKSIINSVLAFLATYSFGHGMVLWVLIAPREFMSFGRRRTARLRWCLPLLWYAAAAAGSLALYFYNYHPARGKPPMTHFLQHPIDAAGYYFAWLGNTLVPDGSPLPSGVRMLVGAVVLGLFTAWIGTGRRRLSARHSHGNGAVLHSWATLGAYSILSGAIVTIGRSGFGINQAAEGRYTSFSLYLTLAAIVAGTQLLPPARSEWKPWRSLGRGLGWSAVAAVLALHVSATVTSVHSMGVRSGCMKRAKTALVLCQIAPETALLSTLYPDPPKLLSEFTELKSHGLLRYRALPAEEFRAACEKAGPVDRLNGCVDGWSPEGTRRVTFRGWVRLPDTGMPGSNAILTWAGNDGRRHPFAVAAAGIPRRDVMDAFHDKRMTNCGFVGTTDLRRMPRRPVRIEAWTVDLTNWSVHRVVVPAGFLRRPS